MINYFFGGNVCVVCNICKIICCLLFLIWWVGVIIEIVLINLFFFIIGVLIFEILGLILEVFMVYL